MRTHLLQGNGISARDIKAVIEAGYNTVESVAYTSVSPCSFPFRDSKSLHIIADLNDSFLRLKASQKQKQINSLPRVCSVLIPPNIYGLGCDLIPPQLQD